MAFAGTTDDNDDDVNLDVILEMDSVTAVTAAYSAHSTVTRETKEKAKHGKEEDSVEWASTAAVDVSDFHVRYPAIHEVERLC